ncbi:hypothetical protein AAFF_G00355120 [Aldrovandia affinis]|uniref:Uncharacterized protein n=1 Tax=Aldrovandia affinis TaxID=143900 RepID=A0AAD7SIJ5_9TELE|nr:hypothetical protein AAFF_G00355120 [Aldrovandia affinis]
MRIRETQSTAMTGNNPSGHTISIHPHYHHSYSQCLLPMRSTCQNADISRRPRFGPC